jgi:LysM repeat protein
MPLSLSNKLQKLKITSFAKSNRKAGGISFEVMFNPASISVKHENKYSKRQGINTKGRTPQYTYTHSDEIELEIVLDGTGVTDVGITTLRGLGAKSVPTQIKQFMEMCFYMDGNIHEPKYLKIQWGEGILKNFDCRLESVDIEYSLFDRNGASLHAVLKAKFIQDVDQAKRPLLEGKKSPDLTHVRVVKSGDTLPLLSNEIYGSSQYYLRIAQINNINDFRNLTPGQELIFPPLDKNQTGGTV